VRQDARARIQLGEQLVLEHVHRVRQQVHGEHGGLADVGLEQVLDGELGAIGHTLQLGRLVRFLHQLLVDVHAEAARAEHLGGREHDAPVARPQVDDESFGPTSASVAMLATTLLGEGTWWTGGPVLSPARRR
jgi:hypothetical protein